MDCLGLWFRAEELTVSNNGHVTDVDGAARSSVCCPWLLISIESDLTNPSIRGSGVMVSISTHAHGWWCVAYLLNSELDHVGGICMGIS